VPLAHFFAFELGGRVENIRLFSSLWEGGGFVFEKS
jgi:hypothetical protein